jgi:PAS domain S-box-containing protein
MRNPAGWNHAHEPRWPVPAIESNQAARDIMNAETGNPELPVYNHGIFFDFSPVAHFLLDQRGSITGVNLMGARILGCKRKALLKEPLSRFIEPVDHPLFRKQLDIHSRPCLAQPCEIGIRKADGTAFHASLHSMPVQDDRGRVLGYCATLVDIGGLKEKEERYRIVADNTFDWEYWLDPDGLLLYVSPSCKRITGHEAAAFLSDARLLNDIVHPEDRSCFDLHVRTVHENGADGEIEFRISHRDGSVRWIGHVCHSVYDVKGTFRGRRVSNRDITPRKKTEEALIDQQRLLSAFCDTSPDAIFIKDHDSRILFANPAFLRTVGKTSEQVLGKDAGEFFDDAEVAARLIRNDQRIMQSGLPETLEETVPTPDGDRVFLTCKAPYRDTSGRIIGVFAITRDITERKYAEEALKNARRDLEIRVRERTGELLELNKKLANDIREKRRIEKVLKKREGELSRRSDELKEMNVTLRTLLKQRDRDKKELEIRILSNVHDLIKPCMDKLKKSRMDDHAKTCVAVLESNLGEIISPFAHHHANRFLSPTETQVANFIKEGLRSKEIGELLSVTKGTIDFYRNNIRKKLGIRNVKTGLRSHLLSLTF